MIFVLLVVSSCLGAPVDEPAGESIEPQTSAKIKGLGYGYGGYGYGGYGSNGYGNNGYGNNNFG